MREEKTAKQGDVLQTISNSFLKGQRLVSLDKYWINMSYFILNYVKRFHLGVYYNAIFTFMY